MARIDDSYCQVCRNEQRVTLPLWPLVDPASYTEEPPALNLPAWKTYPCPECTNPVPENNVVLLECSTKIYDRAPPSVVIGMARDHMRETMIAAFEKRQLITYEKIAPEGRERFRMAARIGIVAPGHVAAMADRIAEHQTTLASEVITEAERQIMVWGSHYHGSDGPISKDTAARAVREALQTVLKRRAKIAAAEGSST